uniref:Uncharacterized protein n=1 Tax=Timema genevievae TaxID=629358 RepID=A0A7R9JX32_TIMGE|nr:unnamed protein product [Timema genevievae]
MCGVRATIIRNTLESQIEEKHIPAFLSISAVRYTLLPRQVETSRE